MTEGRSSAQVQIRPDTLDSRLIDYNHVLGSTFSSFARFALEESRQIPNRHPKIADFDILSNPFRQLVGYSRGSVSGVDEEDRGVVVLMPNGSSC